MSHHDLKMRYRSQKSTSEEIRSTTHAHSFFIFLKNLIHNRIEFSLHA